MADVGVIYRFRVAPENDQKAEEIMREIYTAMAAEEFPTGDVMTYSLFRDPSEPGKWVLFEHFTEEGGRKHGFGPLIYDPGIRHQKLLAEPYERLVLDPVIVHGCGEKIANAPAKGSRSDDPRSNVGVVYSFRVAPENDAEVEGIMREIFSIMAEEEYPTGDVITYTLYRDPSELGRWYMFEYFTAAGSENHATCDRIFPPGRRQLALMVEPYSRVLLDPVIIMGCGEPIPGGAAARAA